MFVYFKVPISSIELVKRTVNKIIGDDLVDLSAELAFYLFLALFPALLFIVSLMAYLPLESAFNPVLNRLGQIAPPAVVDIIRNQVRSLSGSSSLLTAGILGAIWTSSSAMVAIIQALDDAYEIEETRAWWIERLVAIALTIGLVVFILIAFSLILVGPQIVNFLDRSLHIGPMLKAIWTIARWPVAFVFAILAVDLVYHFAPNADSKWVWVTPGSLTATLLFIGSSLGFRLYIVNFGKYNATYGAIGSVIVLLLWFYFSGFSLLAGAELDSAIDEASGHRLKPVAPGRRRKIGAACDSEDESL